MSKSREKNKFDFNFCHHVIYFEIIKIMIGLGKTTNRTVFRTNRLIIF